MTEPIDVLLAERNVQSRLPVRRVWRRNSQGQVRGLGLMEAQNLLDWLERQECKDLVVQVQPDGLFTVRCTCPDGFHLVPAPGGSLPHSAV